jgi:hypothetical protein
MGWAARANRSEERHDPPKAPLPTSRTKDMRAIRDYLHEWFGVPVGKRGVRIRVAAVPLSYSPAARARRAERRRPLATAFRRRRYSQILKRPKYGVVTRWTMTNEEAAAWDTFYGRKREAIA